MMVCEIKDTRMIPDTWGRGKTASHSYYDKTKTRFRCAVRRNLNVTLLSQAGL